MAVLKVLMQPSVSLPVSCYFIIADKTLDLEM